MVASRYVVGIDLGTTNSALAYVDTGSDTEVVFIEGLDSASTELRRTVERVSQEALARELYELDSSAGFNVGYALAARFRLAQRKGALRDLAASAAGALAGSLREI